MLRDARATGRRLAVASLTPAVERSYAAQAPADRLPSYSDPVAAACALAVERQPGTTKVAA